MVRFDADMTKALKEIEKLQKISKQITQFAYETFKDNTPVRSGNARRNTRLQGDTIVAQYAYAEVLDEGRGFRDGQMRGSRQAPEGMTKPTAEAVDKKIDELVKK